MPSQKTLEASGNNVPAEFVRSAINMIEEFWSVAVTRRNFSQISRAFVAKVFAFDYTIGSCPNHIDQRQQQYRDKDPLHDTRFKNCWTSVDEHRWLNPSFELS